MTLINPRRYDLLTLPHRLLIDMLILPVVIVTVGLLPIINRRGIKIGLSGGTR